MPGLNYLGIQNYYGSFPDNILYLGGVKHMQEIEGHPATLL